MLVCTCCKKPNAHTTKECNVCGPSLEGVVETFNGNVSLGLVYGFWKGGFLTTSLVGKSRRTTLCLTTILA